MKRIIVKHSPDLKLNLVAKESIKEDIKDFYGQECKVIVIPSDWDVLEMDRPTRKKARLTKRKKRKYNQQHLKTKRATLMIMRELREIHYIVNRKRISCL